MPVSRLWKRPSAANELVHIFVLKPRDVDAFGLGLPRDQPADVVLAGRSECHLFRGLDHRRGNQVLLSNDGQSDVEARRTARDLNRAASNEG